MGEIVLIVFKFQDLDVLWVFFAIAQIAANKTKLCLLCEIIHFLWDKAMENYDFELTLLGTMILWILLIVSLTVSFVNFKNWDDCLVLLLGLIFLVRILKPV